MQSVCAAAVQRGALPCLGRFRTQVPIGHFSVFRLGHGPICVSKLELTADLQTDTIVTRVSSFSSLCFLAFVLMNIKF